MVIRGEAGREVGGMGKRSQLYSDGWKLKFGGEHAVVYTEGKV